MIPSIIYSYEAIRGTIGDLIIVLGIVVAVTGAVLLIIEIIGLFENNED